MEINNYLGLLRHVGLFKGFSIEELKTLFNENLYKISKYKKGNIIHFESESCNYFDIILEGKVIVQKIDEKGNVLTVTEFRTRDNIGGNLLFSKNPFYPMSVVAKTDTDILHMSREFILRLCQNNEEFLINYLTCISDKTTILTNKIKSISMKTIRESIIDFLNYEYYAQKSKHIKLTMTKKELAERLGIQRTSLSRELNKMKKDGLVDYTPNSIIICDISIIKK